MADGPASPPELPETASSAGDEEFEAFFREGEAGTYKGGPSDSIAPSSSDLVLASERALPPAFLLDPDLEEPDDAFYEQLEARRARRARYQKRVAQVLAGMGALIAAAVAIRVVRQQDDAVAPVAAAPGDQVVAAIEPPRPSELSAPEPPQPDLPAEPEAPPVEGRADEHPAPQPEATEAAPVPEPPPVVAPPVVAPPVVAPPVVAAAPPTPPPPAAAAPVAAPVKAMPALKPLAALPAPAPRRSGSAPVFTATAAAPRGVAGSQQDRLARAFADAASIAAAVHNGGEVPTGFVPAVAPISARVAPHTEPKAPAAAPQPAKPPPKPAGLTSLTGLQVIRAPSTATFPDR